MVKVKVKESVRIGLKDAINTTEPEEYAPGEYTFQVQDRREVYISDSSKVEISFNGIPLGPSSATPGERRFAFSNSNLDPAKKPH